jgi:hypothetical protein
MIFQKEKKLGREAIQKKKVDEKFYNHYFLLLLKFYVMLENFNLMKI